MYRINVWVYIAGKIVDPLTMRAIVERFCERFSREEAI